MDNARVCYRQACPECRRRGKDRAGDNLAVYLDGHSYCFACHYYIPTPSIEGLKKAANEAKLVSTNSPIPDALDWPEDTAPVHQAIWAKPGVAWLKKYGITDDEILKHKVGWSVKRMLLVFPVYEQGQMVLWQGRNFDNGPKYLTGGLKNDILYLVGQKNKRSIIMTEDLVSAIKVGREYQAAPLWGTNMSIGLIRKVASQFDTMGIWLDRGALKEAVRIALRSSQYIPTFIVDSGLDPKEYSSEYIHEFVENASYKRMFKDSYGVIPREKDDAPTCAACGGSGIASNGKACFPCVNTGRITVDGPNDDEGLLRKAHNNWKKTMENFIARQPCTKCNTTNPDIKKVCVVKGCPYFDPSKCEAGADMCMQRGCENCLAEYGEACVKSGDVNHNPGLLTNKEWQYKKSNSGS